MLGREQSPSTSRVQLPGGWQAIEDGFRLNAWSQPRRLVVLSRRSKHDVALTTARLGDKAERGQLVLSFGHDEVLNGAQIWDYTVLVTSVPHHIRAIDRCYRDPRRLRERVW